MRIGFDIDDVLADFSTAYADYILPNIKIPAENINTSQPYWDHSIPDQKDVRKVVDDLYNDSTWWQNLKPKCSKEEIEKIKLLYNKKDTYVYFITSRPCYLMHETTFWIKNHFDIINPNIVIGARSKGLICKGLNIADFIDDQYAQALEIANNGLTRSFLLTKNSMTQENPTVVNKVYRITSLMTYLEAANV